jgi:prepilin-type N-terminal cleavage/methylation domain-containing protein
MSTNDCGLARDGASREGGFTLVEVLIAMVILTIALVSMAELMAVTLRMQMLGRNETAAIRLVQSKIDELVAVDFDAVGTAVAIGGGLDADFANYNDDPVAGYHRRWQIEEIAGETKVRTLTVRVIPSIADRRTNAQVQLTTIIRDP